MLQHVDGPALRADLRDNVAVARCATAAGSVPAGHKLALRRIAAGEAVVKHGVPVGRATADIPAGAHVHVHNVSGFDGIAAVAPPGTGPGTGPADGPGVAPERLTFRGFRRADGRVGTRNTVGVFVVGNCGATVARTTADRFDAARLAAFPNVDAVVPYVHEIGCGMEMTGEPMDLLRRTISGTIRNPNTAAAVVIALGCERNNLRGFLEQERLEVGERLHTVTMQEVGGTVRAIEDAERWIEAVLPLVNRAEREEVGAEHLVLGLQTAAPDGFCGLSAHPALGAAVDLLVRHGGTAILSETPDLHALGPALAARGATPEVRDALAERLRWWREHARGRDTQIAGRLGRVDTEAGLSTPLEKAVDTLLKAGSTPVTGAYRYAELVGRRGLVFMDTPSYEPASVTGQVAGGATLVAMATGRGSIFGSLPAPTVKLAGSTDAFKRFADDTDIDCGPVLDSGVDVAEMGEAVLRTLLRHASGERTRAEVDGMGENEFVPWPVGVLA